MAYTWLISDLHLCNTPELADSFIAWINQEASCAERLCILGDLFEVWLGDDTITDGLYAPVIQTLKALTGQGVELLVMHGNRDFLLGKGFEQATGATIITDPMLVNWYGLHLLLSHGDALCTDDLAYQEFRTQIRNPIWQQQFLALPLSERIRLATQARQQSQQETANKSAMMMDVNEQAVAAMFKQYQYPLLIHGHTHKPHVHKHQVDGLFCQRWVLGDWRYQARGISAECIKLDVAGIHPVTLKLAI